MKKKQGRRQTEVKEEQRWGGIMFETHGEEEIEILIGYIDGYNIGYIIGYDRALDLVLEL